MTLYELRTELMTLLEMAEDPDVDEETLRDTMENPLDSLCNFDEKTLKMNLEIAGFSIPDVKLQEVKSNYVVQAGMVEQWFNNPPSPGQLSTKERYLKYFDEATVDKFMQDVQNYLTGREISLKTNAVFINATK